VTRLEAEAGVRRSTAAIKQRIIQESIDSYPEPCACEYNVARNESSCGGRSAHSRGGSYASICYARDVTTAMVEAYRRSPLTVDCPDPRDIRQHAAA